MKKVLLGTTALVAAGLILGGASAAQAQAKKEGPIVVGIGGYFYGYFAGNSQDDGAATTTQAAQPGFGVRNYGIFRKSRIQFNGRTDLDNGLKVGIRVQLRGEANSTDQIDQSNLWFDSQFGRFELGKTRGAAFNMHYAAPSIQDSVGDPWSLNFGDFQGMSTPSGNLLNGGHSSYIELGRSEKIIYYTPRFAGFQLGVSFAPDGCWVTGQSGASSSTQGITAYQGSGGTGCSIGTGLSGKYNAGQQSNVLGLGANYVNKLGPVDLAVSLGYMSADVESAATGVTPAAFKNQQAWNAGVNVGFAGFLLGGGYAWDNNGTNRAALAGTTAGKDANHWNIGLVYAWDRWRVGVNYMYSDIKAVNFTGAGLGKDKYQGVELGGAYTLGPGITLSAGAEWQKWESYKSATDPTLAASENSGWVYQVGTVLRF
jgi:outer membrane protein OmpU